MKSKLLTIVVVFFSVVGYSQTAAINKVWYEHNVNINGVVCMGVHVNFQVNDAMYRNGQTTIYLLDENGNQIRDLNGAYADMAGNVAAFSTWVSQYPNAVFPDFVLYLPYNEMHALLGNHNYYFVVCVYVDNNPLARIAAPCFSLNGGNNMNQPLIQQPSLQPSLSQRSPITYKKSASGRMERVYKNSGGGGYKKTDHECNSCHGSGKCRFCAGRGEKRNTFGTLFDCTFCHGGGQCSDCHGKGTQRY